MTQMDGEFVDITLANGIVVPIINVISVEETLKWVTVVTKQNIIKIDINNVLMIVKGIYHAGKKTSSIKGYQLKYEDICDNEEYDEETTLY